MNYLFVCLGASLGAVVRYWISMFFRERHQVKFPYATLLVNLTGAFLLGLMASLYQKDSTVYLLLGTGFLGGYTTFSTFNEELWVMLANKRWLQWLTYFSVSYGGGIILAFIGYKLC